MRRKAPTSAALPHVLNEVPQAKPGTFDVIIETPKGSRNKYDWEPAKNAFRMSKVLPEGHVFPYDFGFIPDTIGEDGDPLDVLVFTDAAVGFPGCLVEVRLIGIIEAEQTERDGDSMRNDRLLAVATVSHTHQYIQTAKELPPHVIEEVVRFFTSYNEQAGKRFQVLGVSGPQAASDSVRLGRQKAV